jgi:hypothetical protein
LKGYIDKLPSTTELDSIVKQFTEASQNEYKGYADSTMSESTLNSMMTILNAYLVFVSGSTITLLKTLKRLIFLIKADLNSKYIKILNSAVHTTIILDSQSASRFADSTTTPTVDIIIAGRNISTYQWYTLDSATAISKIDGATTSTYSVTVSTITGYGQMYLCKLTDSTGASIYSDIIAIVPTTGITIINDIPVIMNIREGTQNPELSVTPSTDIAKTKFAWYKNDS